jgi:nucleoside-diphosphate-sugar epimerase
MWISIHIQHHPTSSIHIHPHPSFLHHCVIKDNREFLDPAIKGTTEVLKSVKAFAPTVIRVVITSSCAAVVDFAAPPATSPMKTYTEEDWNPTTMEQALSGPPSTAYQASKKFAEQAGLLTPPFPRDPKHHIQPHH